VGLGYRNAKQLLLTGKTIDYEIWKQQYNNKGVILHAQSSQGPAAQSPIAKLNLF
jgi:hypothetical protein